MGCRHGYRLGGKILIGCCEDPLTIDFGDHVVGRGCLRCCPGGRSNERASGRSDQRKELPPCSISHSLPFRRDPMAHTNCVPMNHTQCVVENDYSAHRINELSESSKVHLTK